MHATDAIDRLAELAHDLWRDRMEQSGWSCATDFNPRTKHHDALVPFGELPTADRDQAVLGVRALGCLEQLAGTIDYQRGPDRPFTLNEMREGLRVVTPADSTLPTPIDPTAMQHGRVVSWREAQGSLLGITIEWADGSRSEHHPAAKELSRLDELEGADGQPGA